MYSQHHSSRKQCCHDKIGAGCSRFSNFPYTGKPQGNDFNIVINNKIILKKKQKNSKKSKKKQLHELFFSRLFLKLLQKGKEFIL